MRRDRVDDCREDLGHPACGLALGDAELAAIRATSSGPTACRACAPVIGSFAPVPTHEAACAPRPFASRRASTFCRPPPSSSPPTAGTSAVSSPPRPPASPPLRRPSTPVRSPLPPARSASRSPRPPLLPPAAPRIRSSRYSHLRQPQCGVSQRFTGNSIVVRRRTTESPWSGVSRNEHFRSNVAGHPTTRTRPR